MILAPPGTPISVSGMEEYEKVVLLEVGRGAASPQRFELMH